MSQTENARSNDCLPSASTRREGWLHYAMYGWLGLAVAASVKSVVEPRLHTVYTTFSGAARDWWAGHSLYIGREFFYSPSFAVAMTPFAAWPDWLGGVFWTCASCGLLLYSLRAFYRQVLPAASWPRRAEGQFLLLVLVGTARSVWSGQSNALLVAMVLLAAVEIQRGRWWRAALGLAAPIHIKVWPVVAGGLFAVQSPRRLAARLALCVAALGLIPFLTQSPSAVIGQYAGWYHCLADRQTGGGRYTGYRDAWTIWEQVHRPVDARSYLVLQLGTGLAILIWCLWQHRRGLPPRQMAVYTISAWSAWQLLMGPGTERLTYNLIAPALAWGVLTCFHSGRQRAWISAAYLATYLLGIGGVERLLMHLWPAATALEPVGVLIFAAWLAWHASRAKPWPSELLPQSSFTAPTAAARHGRAA
jgi:hypothetical protein